MKKLYIALILFLLVLCGCTKKENESNKGCDINDPCSNDHADMSEYQSYIDSEEYVFVVSNVKEMKEKMDHKDDFVVYFGFAGCPWCKDLMPILNDAAKQSDVNTVYYVNTRENKEWKSNIDIDDYDIFVEIADEYLDFDDAGIKHLYVPMVFFIKDGEINGVVDKPDYDATKEEMTDIQKEELLKKFIEEFNKLK